MHVMTPDEQAAFEERRAAQASQPATYNDYDREMEAYLKEVRVARGYSDREPEAYATSSNTRWAQDAKDWVDFRDRVMTYGLEVENKYSAGEPVPTLDEFKAHLRTIEVHWTYAMEG